MNTPEPMQFIQSDKYLGFLFEQNSWFTVVPIDGRAHRTGEATWFGDSVGHWEGDTLVFNTIGLQGWPHTIVDRTGAIHSDELHVVTRMRRLDANTMEADMVLTDPVAFKAPWHVVKHYRKLPPGTHIYDYSCAENNRNLLSPSGRTLTRGSDGKIIDKDRR
jgi:hypothetical protein